MHRKLYAPTQLLLAAICSTALAWTASAQQDVAPEGEQDAVTTLRAAQRLHQDALTVGRAAPALPPRPTAQVYGTFPAQSPLAQERFYSGAIAQWRVGPRMDPRSAAKVRELTNAIRKSEDDTEKEELREQLQEELEAQYDAYLEQLEKPLAEMEERLDKLREEYEKRKSNRDELVKLRLDTIWYDANGMGWPDRGNPLFSVPHAPTVEGVLYPEALDGPFFRNSQPAARPEQADSPELRVREPLTTEPRKRRSRGDQPGGVR